MGLAGGQHETRLERYFLEAVLYFLKDLIDLLFYDLIHFDLQFAFTP
jgi:hypothetical protein